MAHAASLRRIAGRAGVGLIALVAGLAVPPVGFEAPATPAAARSSTRLAAAGAGYGIAVGGAVQSLPAAEQQRLLDGVASVGASWVRLDLPWSRIERVRGVFSWDLDDRTVLLARARHLGVLAMLGYTPRWAAVAGCSGSDKCAPADPDAYGAYVARTVAHYRLLGVHVFELWNEPNIAAVWRPHPNAVAYTRALCAGYRAAKDADAQAVVLTGGLSPYGAYPAPTSAAGVDPQRFLQQIYAAGGGSCFDALALHPYTFDSPAGPAGREDWNPWHQIAGSRASLGGPSLRAILGAHGDAAKPIWITEYGEPVYSPRLQPRGHSEPEQARRLRQTLARYLQLDDTGPLFYYSYRDPTSNSGLVRNDWTRRPAWSVFRQAAAGRR